MFRKMFLHSVCIVVGVLCCAATVSAQFVDPVAPPTPTIPQFTPRSCVLNDPGPRPAGDFVVYTVADGNGNIISNFAQQSQDGNNNSSGSPLPNLTPAQNQFWQAGLAKFGDLISVKGAPSTEPLPGLGPRFNGNSCFMCHSQPAIGGTSPGPGTPLIPPFNGNPQIALAHHRGATNTIPSIVSNRPNGPVVEARFPRAIDASNNPVNSLDGSVQQLFTIKGRDDQPTPCTISQPPLDAEFNNNNLIMRIPTPTFGVGFVETTPDETLIANLSDSNLATLKSAAGVGGRFNSNGNDQTITRFGWKAQNASLLIFAGEASNVETGVTNEVFPFERRAVDCDGNSEPEDFTTPNGQTSPTNPVAIASNVELESFFMFANTPPAQCDFGSGASGNPPAPNCKALSAAALDGQTQFTKVGCNLCHSPTLTSGPSKFTDLNNAQFHPFSDFAIHHMGAGTPSTSVPGLADGVTQGAAGPDEFRTAPLWGAGQRFFFLHDGRYGSIVDAVEAHSADNTLCTSVGSVPETFILNGQTVTIPSKTTKSCGSEANGVLNSFHGLGCTHQQNLIDFLRSL
ncbi:MAG TPA: di-heme oxidoredictase family protein [Candidatus Angelobacter sp.]